MFSGHKAHAIIGLWSVLFEMEHAGGSISIEMVFLAQRLSWMKVATTD